MRLTSLLDNLFKHPRIVSLNTFYFSKVVTLKKNIPNYLSQSIEEIQHILLLLINETNQFFHGLSPIQIILLSFMIWIIISFIYSTTKLIATLIYNLIFYYDETKAGVLSKLLDTLKKIPIVKNKIQKLRDQYKETFKKTQKGLNSMRTSIVNLPHQKIDMKNIIQILDARLSKISNTWKDGKYSGAVYSSSKSLTDLCTEIYKRTMFTNPLHVDIFDEIQHMENEVIEMVAQIFNGDSNTCGTINSCGTESIMLACKAYRNLAHSKGITHPNIVAPLSAHAAFAKSADLLEMSIHLVPLNLKTGQCDLKSYYQTIDSNTCMVVASAPGFPHGIIDQVKEISEMARKKSIGCHVDCCLGGFVLPFMDDAGFKIDPFDFRLPGVTSISADTHKYGLTPKGSSILLYRNEYYKSFQIFVNEDWIGGMYATPTFSGSRSGATIAVTWGVLLHTGLTSYINKTRKICDTFRRMLLELYKIDEVEIIGKPKVHTVAFATKNIESIKLFQVMSQKGYHLGFLQNPSAIHLTITRHHTKDGNMESLLKDLKDSIQEVKENIGMVLSGNAAIYGQATAIIDRRMIRETLVDFVNVSTKLQS